MSLRIRRGGGVAPGTPDPPPPAQFGPGIGAAATRTAAAPNVVTDPGVGIPFTTSSGLNSAIASNPSNSTFVAAGNISWDSSVVFFQKNPTVIVPTGRIMDGGGRNIWGINTGAAVGVTGGGTVRGGTWQNFGTTGNGPFLCQANSIVEDITSLNNFQGFTFIGQTVLSAPMTLRRARIAGSKFYGITGTIQGGTDYVNNIRISNVEMANSNTGNFDKGNGASFKIVKSRGTRITGLWSHNNNGAGVWFDGSNENAIVEESVVESCNYWGIFYELSYGNTIIRNNALYDNGIDSISPWWPSTIQLMVSTSRGDLANIPPVPTAGIDIHHNIVDGVGICMGLFNYDPRDYTAGVAFHDNDVWMRAPGVPPANTDGWVGGRDSRATKDMWTRSSNSFVNNSYHTPAGRLAGQLFSWDSGTGDGAPKTFAEWKAYHPLDGTLVAI